MARKVRLMNTFTTREFKDGQPTGKTNRTYIQTKKVEVGLNTDLIGTGISLQEYQEI